jgi:hypothetical protein
MGGIQNETSEKNLLPNYCQKIVFPKRDSKMFQKDFRKPKKFLKN